MDDLLNVVLIIAFWWFLGIPFLRYVAHKALTRAGVKPPDIIQKTVIEHCPPHKWDYYPENHLSANQMYCKRCGNRPGYVGRNN